MAKFKEYNWKIYSSLIYKTKSYKKIKRLKRLSYLNNSGIKKTHRDYFIPKIIGVGSIFFLEQYEDYIDINYILNEFRIKNMAITDEGTSLNNDEILWKVNKVKLEIEYETESNS